MAMQGAGNSSSSAAAEAARLQAIQAEQARERAEAAKAAAAQKAAATAQKAPSNTRQAIHTDSFQNALPKPPLVLDPRIPDGNVGVSGKGSVDVNGKEVGFDFGVGIFKTSDTNVSPDTEPGANGNSIITVTTRAGVDAKAGVDGDGWKVDVGFQNGVQEKYTATVTPAQLAAIQAGGPPPSPYQPDKMPAGTRITFESGSFSNENVGVTLGKFGIDSSVSIDKGQAASVTKLPGNKVQISIGPQEEIDAEDKFGVNAFGVSGEFGTQLHSEAGTVHQVTLDLNNPQAREMYASFLQNGTVPASNNPAAGVTGAQTVSSYNSDAQQSGSLTFHGIGIHAQGPDVKSNAVSVTRADGTRTDSFGVDSGDGKTISVRADYDASGKNTNTTADVHIDNESDLASPAGTLDMHLDKKTLAAYQNFAQQFLKQNKDNPAALAWAVPFLNGGKTELPPELSTALAPHAQSVAGVADTIANGDFGSREALFQSFQTAQKAALAEGIHLPNPFTITPH